MCIIFYVLIKRMFLLNLYNVYVFWYFLKNKLINMLLFLGINKIIKFWFERFYSLFNNFGL